MTLFELELGKLSRLKAIQNQKTCSVCGEERCMCSDVQVDCPTCEGQQAILRANYLLDGYEEVVCPDCEGEGFYWERGST